MDLLKVAVLAAIGLYGAYRTSFWLAEGKKLTTRDGYVPPAQTWLAKVALKFFSYVMTLPTIGRIKVIGRENVYAPGRLMILGNHSFELDFAVTQRAMPVPYRQIGALNQLLGLRAPFAAWTGFVAVNTDGGKAKSKETGEKVVQAYANVLKHGADSRLMLFPQGKLVYTGELLPEDFRTGAVRGMQIAAKDVNPSELAVLPFAIHYHKVRHGRTGLSQFFSRFGGATVVIGERIPYSALPQDPRDATEFVRQQIASLLDQAKSRTARSVA